MPLSFAARGPIVVPAGGAYTGPGDIISGASAWWGLRGYNAAYSGSVIDVVDQAGANPATFGLVSNVLDVASISAWVTAHSVTTIKVTKVYDQTGNAVHLTQATLANMPELQLSLFGSLPGILAVSLDGNQGLVSPSFTRAQPFNISTVAKVAIVAGNGELVCNVADTGRFMQFNTGPDVYRISAGTSNIDQATTLTTAHAWQGTFNGASSVSNIDTTEASGVDIGSVGFSSDTITILSRIPGTSANNWSFGELGIWPNAWTTGQRNSIQANQKSYWGTP